MLLLITQLVLLPLQAHHIPEAQQLSGEEICAAVTDELDHSVAHNIITHREATKVIIRCYLNYS